MKKLLWIGLPSLGLMTLVIVLLPLGLEFFAESWLEDHGVENPAIGNVDLNLFTGVLRVEELSISGSADQTGELRLAETNFEWTGLLGKRVSIRDTRLSGGRFDVHRLPNGTTLVGDLQLPLISAQADQPPQADAPRQSDWGVGLRSVRIEDLAIRYRDTSLDSVIDMRAADLDRLDSLAPAQNSVLTADLRFDDADIKVRAEGTPLAAEPEMTAEASVSGFLLQKYESQLGGLGIDELGGTLALELSTTVRTLANRSLQADTAIRMEIEDLTGARDIAALGSDRLTWSGDLQTEVSPDADIPPHVTGTSKLRVAGLNVRHRGKPITLLALDEFAVEDAVLDESGELRFERIVLTGLDLAQHDEDTDPTAQAARLTFENVIIGTRPILDIGKIALNSSIIRIRRQSDGTLRLVTELVDDFKALRGGTEPDAGEDPVADDATLPLIRIGEFEVDDSSRIVFNDVSVTPTYSGNFDLRELRLTGITTVDPETPAHLVLDIEQEDSARITGEGDLTLFADKPRANITFGLKNFDLTQISSYIPGYHIQRGRLSVDSQAILDGDALDISNKVVLEKLKLSAKVAGEGDTLGEAMAMPLDVTLDLLRDSNDRIGLELPVSGSLKDPKFGTGDVLRLAMQTAMQKAAIRYATNALQPLGMIMFVAKVAGKASRPRFEPVGFAAGQATLTTQAEDYLDKIASLLAERPKLSITLCGMATPEDLAFMLAQIVPPDGEGAVMTGESQESGTATELPTFDVERTDLAKARGTAVQQYFVSEHAVAADRLFRCRPRIEVKAADGPRVEITL